MVRAIILAAGRGERMRPLTNVVPKALLAVGGKPLIVWHVEKLAAAGITRIVINHAHLGSAIEQTLGNGARYGVEFVYSRETEALETAGGIAYAAPLLGNAPFAAINADVYSDFDYTRLIQLAAQFDQHGPDAHLVLIDNPAHHAAGDFALHGARVALGEVKLTFSGIALYRPEMFAGILRGAKAPLAPLLRERIAAGRVSGEHFRGQWRDIGTPERLAELNRQLAARGTAGSAGEGL